MFPQQTIFLSIRNPWLRYRVICDKMGKTKAVGQNPSAPNAGIYRPQQPLEWVKSQRYQAAVDGHYAVQSHWIFSEKALCTKASRAGIQAASCPRGLLGMPAGVFAQQAIPLWGIFLFERLPAVFRKGEMNGESMENVYFHSG